MAVTFCGRASLAWGVLGERKYYPFGNRERNDLSLSFLYFLGTNPFHEKKKGFVRLGEAMTDEGSYKCMHVRQQQQLACLLSRCLPVDFRHGRLERLRRRSAPAAASPGSSGQGWLRKRCATSALSRSGSDLLSTFEWSCPDLARPEPDER